MDCLRTKPFDDISISDLNKKSFVSRSTFYRLFDTTVDLLMYTCEKMFEDIIQGINEKEFDNPMDLMEFFNKEIMSRDALLDSLVKNHRLDILYNTHTKFADSLLPHFKEYDKQLTKKEESCILHILAASACAYIGFWVENGRKETPKELSALVKKSFDIIASGV